MHSRVKFTAVLLVLISFGFFATDIYLPSLPAIAVYFGVNDAAVRLTLFAYMLSFSCTPLLFGPLSDHWGRKKVVHFGLLVSLIATLGCALSPSIHWFAFCRFIQGIGCGATMISGRAMVTDIFKGKELAKQISYITMSMPLILAVAPLLGGYLQVAFNWQAVFWFLFLYILGVAIMMFKVEESLNHESKKHISLIFKGYHHILTTPSFVLFGLGMAVPAIGTLAYLTASPFIFQHGLGLSPSQYGSLALFVGSAIIVAGYVNIRLLRHFSLNEVLCLGSFCIILSGILLSGLYLAGWFNLWTVLLPAMLFFCCMPLSSANSVSKALSKIHHHFGAANALLSTGQMIAGSVGSLIFSFTPESNPFYLGLCFLIVGLTAAFVLFCAIHSESKTP